MAALPEIGVPVRRTLVRKLQAAAAYATQLGFQFGGGIAMRWTLWNFARSEGQRLEVREAAEAFRAAPGTPLPGPVRSGRARPRPPAG